MPLAVPAATLTVTYSAPVALRGSLTFTRVVGAANHGALLYGSVRGKQLTDILFRLSLTEHAHEQLPVWVREEGTAGGDKEKKKTKEK